MIWVPEGRHGLEHLRLLVDENGCAAGGLVIGVDRERPFHLHYEVRCDAAWVTREVRVRLLDPAGPELVIESDGKGHWKKESGESVETWDGCVDLDLSVTPFTNTLPIRRLELSPGESREIDVAYLRAPGLDLLRARQRYTCLAAGEEGSRYLYESLQSDFRSEITADPDGLVVVYPRFARRLWRL
jgi:hypothetical protein